MLPALVLACVGPPHHTPEPYASDPDAAAALEARAAAFCAERYPSADQRPPRPFVTDGCSLFFDRPWDVGCCVTHDIAYWCGGTHEQRMQADAEFSRCIAENTSRAVGLAMRVGVGIGGQPIFPTHYRWGYGHRYRACFPSNEAQRRGP